MLALGCDHGGYELKLEIKKYLDEKGIEYKDYGCDSTALAYYCYFDAIAHVSTGLGSMSFFIKPGLASLLCAVVLGEPITANILVGIVLILCGLAVSLGVGKQHT